MNNETKANIRIWTECVDGNAPECPQCGNWNALLEEFSCAVKMIHNFVCRDCGFAIPASGLIIGLKKLDAPGYGNYSTYTTYREVNGEEF